MAPEETMKKWLPFLYIIIASCAAPQKPVEVRAVSGRPIRCMILIEESLGGRRNDPGNTQSESILAAALGAAFEVAGADVARASARKLGIRIDESLTGIIDPVIKDYLIGELRMDVVIIGRVSLRPDSSGVIADIADMELRAVRLSDDAVLAHATARVRKTTPPDYTVKEMLNELVRVTIMRDSPDFREKIIMKIR